MIVRFFFLIILAVCWLVGLEYTKIKGQKIMREKEKKRKRNLDEAFLLGWFGRL
jgi:hypothetical protein